MPIGDPGVEQFRDAMTELRNRHIIFALSALFDLRSQIIGNDEFQKRGGVDTTTALYLMQHLQNCDKRRRVITYQPDKSALDEYRAKAISTKNIITGTVLSGQPSGTPLVGETEPFGGDRVQDASGPLRQLPWAIDGTDTDIPLNSQLNYRSGDGFILLQSIDEAIVAWTRLESRFQSRFITVDDSMRMYAHYVQVLELLEIFHGDRNRVDFAQGVRPSEEPRGPGASPNMIGEEVGSSGIKV